MLTAHVLGEFGDARSDIVSALSPFLGRAKVEGFMDSLEARVRSEATKGAEAAIPKIKGEVESTVKPYVIAAIVAGGLGAILGTVAIVRARR